jgi:hypothetical protein
MQTTLVADEVARVRHWFESLLIYHDQHPEVHYTSLNYLFNHPDKGICACLQGYGLLEARSHISPTEVAWDYHDSPLDAATWLAKRHPWLADYETLPPGGRVETENWTWDGPVGVLEAMNCVNVTTNLSMREALELVLKYTRRRI